MRTLSLLKKTQSYRYRYAIESRRDGFIHINKKKYVNFCSNDYLNLSQEPRVIKALQSGAERYGLGSGASVFVTGYYEPHQQLENQFCAFLKRDRALLFSSGYHANLAIMNAFADQHASIHSDKYCHASLIDGIRLSRAKHWRFSHQNFNQLNLRLENDKSQNKWVVTESVFGMEGAITDVATLVKITHQNAASLIVDDAHGFGVLGSQGGGICEHFNLKQQQISLLIHPMGKALGGCGAIVSGSDEVIEHLTQFSRTYMYTTTLPPCVVSAMQKALSILIEESWRRERLNQLIRIFREQANARNLNFLPSLTPIQVLIVGENKLALQIQQQLLNHGFFVAAIRPPTVVLGTARIRFSLNIMHNESQIIQLLDLLSKLIHALPKP